VVSHHRSAGGDAGLAAPRPKRRRLSTYLNIALYLAFVLALVWLVVWGGRSGSYHWEWYRIPRYLFKTIDGEIYLGTLLQGLVITLKIALWSFPLMVLLGLTTAILSTSNSIIGRLIALVYVESIRNTPLLIQLFIFYFVLAPVIGLDRYFTGILTLAGLGGLSVLAHMLDTRLGDVKLAAVRMLGISAAVGLLAFFNVESVFFELTIEAVCQAVAFVGLALVLFFMAAYYRASGVVAAVALVFYTAIVLAIFKLLPVTLTLAGLAGFIVSLGMAVDANILIFERMKEELRIGRTLPFAIQIGFNRAWTSIRDGNISTLLIAGILFLFGTSTANSPVTGFAVSLMIGVLTSMFTAIVVTRLLFELFYLRRPHLAEISI